MFTSCCTDSQADEAPLTRRLTTVALPVSSLPPVSNMYSHKYEAARPDASDCSVASGDSLIAHVQAVVTTRLPSRLRWLHEQRIVPIFASLVGQPYHQDQRHMDWNDNADPVGAQTVLRDHGMDAAARHVLRRGGEVMIRFASGRPLPGKDGPGVPEEFRLCLAYTKFTERAEQMRAVLSKIFDQDLAPANGPNGLSMAPAQPCLPPSSLDALDGVLPAGSNCSERLPAGSNCSGVLPAGSNCSERLARMHVLSLGGGPASDAVGVLAYLVDRYGVSGAVSSQRQRPVVGVLPQKLVEAASASGCSRKSFIATKAERRQAAKQRQGEQRPGAAGVAHSSFSLTEEFVKGLPTVALPRCAWLPAQLDCRNALQCTVLDHDPYWYDCCAGRLHSKQADCGFASIGNVVQRAVAAQTSVSVQWQCCDVTKPLSSRSSENSHIFDGGRATDSAVRAKHTTFRTVKTKTLLSHPETTVGLVVASYLFTVQPGPSSSAASASTQDNVIGIKKGGGHELPVCEAFWVDFLAQHPKAWFIFVEGTISKKLWTQLHEIFHRSGGSDQGGRVLTPPITVVGQLPQRTVVVDTTGGKGLVRARRPRTYCYFYSPPAA
eukprot:SAG31_NODE_7_length_42755_cov_130.245728_14_plen_606_part_00